MQMSSDTSAIPISIAHESPACFPKITRAERAKLIDPEKANCNVPAGTPPPIGTDTTYLCVVDSEGNMVSYNPKQL